MNLKLNGTVKHNVAIGDLLIFDNGSKILLVGGLQSDGCRGVDLETFESLIWTYSVESFLSSVQEERGAIARVIKSENLELAEV